MAKYKNFKIILPKPNANAQVVSEYSVNVYGDLTTNAEVFESPSPVLSDLKKRPSRVTKNLKPYIVHLNP